MLQKKETVPKILKSYLNYLIAIRGYSINTIKAYGSDLMQFFSFIQEYKEMCTSITDFNIFILMQVKEADIIAFLVFLNFNKNNNPYTRQRKLNTIRTFFKWLFSTYPTGNQVKNPTSNINSIIKMVRIPKHLSLDQARKIQNVFNLQNSNFPARNNAIISLFLCTGVRLSELININLIDVNFENNSIAIIYGKNNKERIVYFNKYCQNKILEYIDERYRKEKVINLNSPLFINKYGKRVGVDAVEDICANAYKLIGLENLGYTTHTLRHTAASLIYTYVKEDILLLKQFLGHSYISTTQIYTHISNKKVKEAVEKHPLSTYDKKAKKEKIVA